MRTPIWSIAVALVVFATPAPRTARATGEDAAQVLKKVLESDPWGLSGGDVSAHATVKDDGGKTKEIVFHARSRKSGPQLTKSLVRVSSPPDLKGVGFLQVQKSGTDDERFLFLPDLARARKIAGNSRGSAFIGTDFSYADMDRRDLRDADAVLKPDETLGKYTTFHLDVTPRASDAVYARIEMWVRKDNFIPIKGKMYAKSGVLLKTLNTEEIRNIGGKSFITKSLMEDHQGHRSTELVLEKIEPSDTVPDDEFTVRNLEKS